MSDLKNFDGLWRMLRSDEERVRDDKLDAHANHECDETCEFCDEIEQMATYFCKQTEEK